MASAPRIMPPQSSNDRHHDATPRNLDWDLARPGERRAAALAGFEEADLIDLRTLVALRVRVGRDVV
jgi:hypothetical protein